MVRSPAARAHPSLHAQSAARGDRAGQPRGFHAVPVRLAARRRRRAAHGIDGLLHVVQRSMASSGGRRLGTRCLPARVDRYDPSMLDMLCLTGQVGWARLSRDRERRHGSSAPRQSRCSSASTPRCGSTLATRRCSRRPHRCLSVAGARVLDALRTRGASFAHETGRACGLGATACAQALGELVVGRPRRVGRIRRASRADRRSQTQPAREPDGAAAGPRWSPAERPRTLDAPTTTRPSRRRRARCSRRYGVVCRRVLTREPNAQPWRMLARVYRRLEARGEIRGGRFVSGLSGEQFALPEAVERLREVRRTPPHAADRDQRRRSAEPRGHRHGRRSRAAVAATRIVYRDGVPLAALEGDYIRPLADDRPVARGRRRQRAGRPARAAGDQRIRRTRLLRAHARVERRAEADSLRSSGAAHFVRRKAALPPPPKLRADKSRGRMR